jgi:hypothetical protein
VGRRHRRRSARNRSPSAHFLVGRPGLEPGTNGLKGRAGAPERSSTRGNLGTYAVARGVPSGLVGSKSPLESPQSSWRNRTRGNGAQSRFVALRRAVQRPDSSPPPSPLAAAAGSPRDALDPGRSG